MIANTDTLRMRVLITTPPTLICGSRTSFYFFFLRARTRSWYGELSYLCACANCSFKVDVQGLPNIQQCLAIAIIMLSAAWTVILPLLLQSLPMVGLECTNGALLRARCSSLSARCEWTHSCLSLRLIVSCLFLYFSISTA